jgi:hypothetical protein
VGAQIEPRLTVDGLRDMIQDWRAAGKKIPTYIVVSEYDRRDLNQDLCAGAKELEGDDVERPEHDGKAIGFIEGVMVRSHPDVAARQGSLRLQRREARDREPPGRRGSHHRGRDGLKR